MAERAKKDDIEVQDAKEVHPQRFVATGDISYGVAEGDERRSLEYSAGDIVDSGDLTEEDLKALLSRGAIRPA